MFLNNVFINQMQREVKLFNLDFINIDTEIKLINKTLIKSTKF